MEHAKENRSCANDGAGHVDRYCTPHASRCRLQVKSAGPILQLLFHRGKKEVDHRQGRGERFPTGRRTHGAPERRTNLVHALTWFGLRALVRNAGVGVLFGRDHQPCCAHRWSDEEEKPS